MRATTAIRGASGRLLDVEAVPPLVVDDLPEQLEPVSPDAPPLHAAAPVILNGRLNPPDEDRFILDVTPRQRFQVGVASNDLGSPLVSELKVLDAGGNVLVASSTAVVVPAREQVPEYLSYDPSTEFTVPMGQTQITLVLRGKQSSLPRDSPQFNKLGFPYRIKVVPMVPGFELVLNDAQVSVPRGGATPVGVTLVRKGFNGPITLRIADPPPGLTFRLGKVAERQTVGSFTVAAAVDAHFDPVNLTVIGEGQGSDGLIVSRATKIIDFGPPTTEPGETVVGHFNGEPVYHKAYAYLRTRITTQCGLFAALVKPDPVFLDAPAGPIEISRGSGIAFKVLVIRPKDAQGALTLRPLSLPPGLSMPETTIGETATEAIIRVNATNEHPLGTVSIVLMARGTITGVEWLLTFPSVNLSVVSPR